jgi:glycosyltransferase involved in cell wall biosynthesis
MLARRSNGEGSVVMSEKILIAICTRGASPNLEVLFGQIEAFLLTSSSQLRVVVVWDSVQCIPDYLMINSRISIIKSEKSGYASVRNTALQNRSDGESILFIDDDERIQPIVDSRPEEKIPQESFSSFLNSYSQLAKQYSSSIFVGKVVPISVHGDLLFDYRNASNNLSQGQMMNYASAGNLFIPNEIFKQGTIVFDEYFNFGGEDSDLCNRLKKLGIFTRWNGNATLFEVTPPERLSAFWQLNRRKKNFLLSTISNRRNLKSLNLFFYFIRSFSVYFFHRIFFPVLKNDRTELVQVEKIALRYLVSGDIAIFCDYLLA